MRCPLVPGVPTRRVYERAAVRTEPAYFMEAAVAWHSSEQSE